MSGSRGNEAVAEYKKALEAMSKVSALKSSPPVSYNWSKVLANLNAKVFPLTPARLASDEDSSVAIRSLLGDVLQVTHYIPCVAFAIASFSTYTLDCVGVDGVSAIPSRGEDGR